jgi:hypothetical protein
MTEGAKTFRTRANLLGEIGLALTIRTGKI